MKRSTSVASIIIALGGALMAGLLNDPAIANWFLQLVHAHPAVETVLGIVYSIALLWHDPIPPQRRF